MDKVRVRARVRARVRVQVRDGVRAQVRVGVGVRVRVRGRVRFGLGSPLSAECREASFCEPCSCSCCTTACLSFSLPRSAWPSDCSFAMIWLPW